MPRSFRACPCSRLGRAPMLRVLCLLALCQPVLAMSAICGIDRVVADEHGVRVYFLSDVNLEGSSLSLGGFEIVNGAIRWPIGGSFVAPIYRWQADLALIQGQKALLVDRKDLRDPSARPTVICSIEYAEADGQIGVRAETISPGPPPAPGTPLPITFISAQKS